jgi:hypothetical protein
MPRTKCCGRKLSVHTTLRLTWAACLVTKVKISSAVLPFCLPAGGYALHQVLLAQAVGADHVAP